RYDGVTGAPLPSPGNVGAFFVPTGSGGLSSPESAAFGPDGNLYVSSFGTQNVLKYDGKTGAFLSVFVPAGSGNINGNDDILFGPDGNLYVANFPGTFDSVLRFNGTTGAPLPSAGNSGATFVPPGSGGLNAANGLAFGPDG